MTRTSTVERAGKPTGSEFLAGGGEIGALMRSLDWSGTPLGPVEAWPQSLRTAVSILLNSRYPMFIAWGPELAFLYNDGYRPIFGAKHPNALGQPFAQVWAEIWTDIAPLVERALAGEATWSDDLRLFMERSGYLEETYFTFSYSPIRGESGRIGGMFCACNESTLRILSERRLRCLHELAAVGSAAKTVEHAHDRCLQVLGAYAEDIPFALLYRRQPEGLAAAGSANVDPDSCFGSRVLNDALAVWPADATTEQATMEVDLPRRLGDTPKSVWGDPVEKALVLPLADRGHPEATGVLVVGINPRRALDDDYQAFLGLVASSIASAAANARAFEDEHRRAEALAEIDRAKTAFFANVSHEFRTPLTLILAPIEDTLAGSGLPDDDRRRLTVAHRNSLRLLKMVNALLEFSRIEAGRAQANYTATDLGAFTAELASNFQSACDRAGLALVVNCPPLPEPAYVDLDLWEKIVLNLVSNAFKFTLGGQITVTLRAAAGTAELQVTDTGIGIAEADIPKVFDRFSRIEGAGGRSHEGTGIGLALVQELVRMHGGGIRVESTVGRGTTFTVWIPLGSDHLAADRIGSPPAGPSVQAEAFVGEAMQWATLADGTMDNPPPLSGAGHSVTPEPTIRDAGGDGIQPARILWVDDNADMRDYVRRLLDGRFRVEAVGDGEAALTAALADPPELVLSDVMLPKLDGIELLHRLRADGRTREVPVVLLSARAGEEAKVEALRAGADDYVVKPFSARELVARIDAQVNARRIRREVASALRESEARFRTLADNAPMMVWATEPDGRCSFLSRSWYDFTGQRPETGLGLNRLDAVHPGDREAAETIFAAANGSASAFRLEYRLRRHDGEYLWTIDSASPRFGEDGEFLGYIGSVLDIDRRKRSEEQRAVLVDELNHRVKNTLAVVQGLARQTFGTPDVPRELRQTFEGRLAALSAAHSQLTESDWRNASLSALAGDVLRAAGPGADQVSIEGSPVDLSPRVAVTMTMAFNELCTNAIKYGALSVASGRVTLEWTIVGDANPRLHLVWRETGGPMVQPPTGRGFGTRFIEQALAQDLEGEVTIDFRPEGLVCTIDAPLPAPQEYSDERSDRPTDSPGRG